MTAGTTPSSPLLIVEDDLALQKQIKWSLDRFDCVTASDRESALVAFRRHQPAVVTMDLGLPPDPDSTSEGFKLLEQLLNADPNVKVIVLTGQNDQANALRAVAMGAYDFFAKPFEPELLGLTIDRAFRLAELQAENRRLQAISQPDALGGLITRDPEMLKVCRMIEKVASSSATVLLLGETGTGKSAAARAIHQASMRRGGPFVVFDCGAVSKSLIESELFGHERGAFTGATARRKGCFETAHKSTLFIDEVGDIVPQVQVKLLRVLGRSSQRDFSRLGGEEPIRTNVRVLAATNKDLVGEIRASRFREDLYYRLSALVVRIPPLRERTSDIPLLLRHIIARMGRGEVPIGKGVAEALCAYHWPGNIRQLANVLRTAAVMATGEATITEAHLSDDFLEDVRRMAPAQVLQPSPPSVPHAAPATPS